MIRSATWEELFKLGDITQYRPSPDARGIVLEKWGEIQGLGLFDRWTHNACQFHIWLPGQMTREFARELSRYPFEIGHRNVVIALVPATAKSADLAVRAGFTEKYRIKDGWQIGEDLILFEMRREECFWLRKRDS